MSNKGVIRSALLSAVLAALSVAPIATALAQNAGDYPLTAIRFPAGKSGTTISDGLERGASATYSFGAKAGQKAALRLKSLENNAVFTVYLPGATVKQGDGGLEVDGAILPGIDRNAGSTRWRGTLPADGNYIVTINGTRGNAVYDLAISIR